MLVYKLAEERVNTGVHDLGSGAAVGTNEKAFHIIQVMSVAVELLVWAVQEESGE